jgi:hypothetical protein
VRECETIPAGKGTMLSVYVHNGCMEVFVP